MNILLSIKPRYVAEIVSGVKKYEFRRTLYKHNVKRVYIYASYPVCKIVGEFTPEGVLSDKPQKLWSRVKEDSGMQRGEFLDYFEGKQTGFAIRIGNMREYRKPIDPASIFPNFRAPQSFCYCESLS